jgi:type I restriction enzyme S subunit
MGERELPAGWEWKRLGNITKIQAGGTPRRGVREYWTNGTIPWVKISDIREKYIETTSECITVLGLRDSSAKIFPRGTILLSIFATLGDIGILKIDATCNQAIAGIIVEDKNVDPDYLYYVLKDLKSHFERIGRGVAQNNINQSILKDTIIPVPPLPIQHQIVAVLEQAEAVKRQRQEADALTGALLQSVFYEMFGDPVTNERRWEQSKLGDCCRVQRGKFTYRPRNEPRFYGGNYPFIQTGDVANCQGKLKKYTQTLNDEGLFISKMFPKGTIVISIAAKIGDTAIRDFDSCFPDSVVGISPDIHKGTVEFFEMMLRFYKKHLWNLAPETAQRNINLRILSELEIIIPPLALQQQFARVVEDVERIREQQVASGRQIEGLCEGLMARAFAGELVT